MGEDGGLEGFTELAVLLAYTHKTHGYQLNGPRYLDNSVCNKPQRQKGKGALLGDIRKQLLCPKSDVTRFRVSEKLRYSIACAEALS